MAAKKYLTSTRIIVPGLRERVRILHITDVHLCRVDASDVHAGAQRRRIADLKRAGMATESRAKQLLAAAATQGFDAVIVTGDLVDFASQASIALAKKLLATCASPLHFVGGNHDSTFPTDKGWMAGEPAAKLARWDTLNTLRPKSFDRWEVGGLQFLTVDDARYQIDAAQLEFVRGQLANGKPTVLAMHIPLTQPRLKSLTTIRWKWPILLGERFDAEQAGKWLADPPARATGAFLKLLAGAKNLRAVLSGHVHFGFEEALSETAVQLVGPPGYEGAFRVVEFAPAGS